MKAGIWLEHPTLMRIYNHVFTLVTKVLDVSCQSPGTNPDDRKTCAIATFITTSNSSNWLLQVECACLLHSTWQSTTGVCSQLSRWRSVDTV